MWREMLRPALVVALQSLELRLARGAHVYTMLASAT